MKNLILFLVVCSLCSATAVYANDDAVLNQAIKSLNAQAKTDADKKLVLNALSQQTKLPEKTLQSQMGSTHLNYGELLVADSLAEGSGKNLNAVLAMRQGKGWADLSKEIKIDPNSIVNRLHSAEKTVQASQGNRKQAGNMTRPANVNPSIAPSAPPMRAGGY